MLYFKINSTTKITTIEPHEKTNYYMYRRYLRNEKTGLVELTCASY